MVELRYSHRGRLAVALVLMPLMIALSVAFILDPEMTVAIRVAFSVLALVCAAVIVLAIMSHRRRAVILDLPGRRVGTRWGWRAEPYWCDLDTVEIATSARQASSQYGISMAFNYLVLWNTEARGPGPTWGAKAGMVRRERVALQDMSAWVPDLEPFMIELNGLSEEKVAQLVAVVPAGAWVRIPVA